MKFSYFKIIISSIFWILLLFAGCKEKEVRPDECLKVLDVLNKAAKTYDTTSTLAKDTLRKRASCINYGIALQNFIKVSYATGCITASDTVNYKRTLAAISCN
jgi:hypothetical protein